jgi:uncharacterized protein YjbI with pentapeptide repeats
MSQRKILFGDLISRYAAGERDFSEVIVKTPSPERRSWKPGQFKGLDLSGIILQNSSITRLSIYMDGVILRGADLTNVDLGESNFEGADLSNAILRGTRFFQSVFEGANLSGADLTGAGLVESTFFWADLSRANLTNARISDLGFICTDLTEAIFNGARLKSVQFDGANLIRADFRRADFGPENDRVFGVKFRDCRFEETLMPDGSVRSS